MRKFLLGLIITNFYLPLYAEEISFREAWRQVDQASLGQEASRLKADALEASKTRASRHWLPRLYLDARSYQTNDPGSAFIGVLEQRKLDAHDFDPQAINHPTTQTFTRGSLGLDLPLYEGGMKQSQTEMLRFSEQAQRTTTAQAQLEQYAQVGAAYGSLMVLAEQSEKLEKLKNEISHFMKTYELGQKSNPVGYSGLLGMRSLSNRLAGLITQYEAQLKSYRALLQEMGVNGETWSPQRYSIEKFVNQYLEPVGESTSFRVIASREALKASEQATQMEKGKFLPRVGLFAENYMFNGSRDTASGYSAGLYLQWNLFDPNEYGAVKVAKLNAMAQAKHAEAMEQQERAEYKSLTETLSSLRANLSLLKESDQLLVEQSEVSAVLFRNGSITALQMVELLNRRADLIAQQTEAESNLLKVAAQAITKQKFDISQHVGGKDEK